MNAEAAALVARLRLEPLPVEGGFFRQTWTSQISLNASRAAGSAIYFLLTPMDFSALHQLRTDELWFFHAGDPVEHVQLAPGGAEPLRSLLGHDVTGSHQPQVIVRGGVWQGARLMQIPDGQPSHGWALLSCVMAPAWDEREFLLGDRERLRSEFPAAGQWIDWLTR